ncbi:MAG TPA: hypothetical protein VFL38_16995 [Humibacillus xanthopallidus]|nr:hypothetical protein [Humibacillus xanthopallidus]
MEPSRLPSDLMIRPFSRREALARGVTPRRLRAQDLWTPTPGVRSVEIPLTLLERACAFAVAAPNDFAFARATAARLHGMPLPQCLEEDPSIHIVTRTADNRVRRGEVVGHRGLETRRVVEIAGLPVVSPADTWVDLGDYVGPGRPVGLDDIIAAGDAAANLERSVDSLAAALRRRVRPRGKVTLDYALPLVRMGSRSAMETRSRLMVVRAGLPEPEMNLELYSPSGDWLGMGDLGWKEERVVGEYQGVEFHSRETDRRKNEVRRERIEDGDWRYLEIVSADVFEEMARAVKLREIAVMLGRSPHLLRLHEAGPQFFAPAKYERPRRRRS